MLVSHGLQFEPFVSLLSLQHFQLFNLSSLLTCQPVIMAPIETTVVIFKDYVNDGKVPEDNFVIKHDKVITKPGNATECRVTTLHAHPVREGF